MNTSFREHERAVLQIVKSLEDDGYAVIREPTQNHFPFDLEGYTPDLLAVKGQERLVIEVKIRGSAATFDRYKALIQKIESNPGWRFLIKNIVDTPALVNTQSSQISDPDSIRAYLEKAQSVARTGAPEMAIPYIWNAIIALLRLEAKKLGLDTGGLTDRSLVNQLYSMGGISQENHERLLNWNQVRNSIVHAMSTSVAEKDVEEMTHFAFSLL